MTPERPDTSNPPDRLLRLGVMSDLHHADRDPHIGRYYRQTRTKTQQAVEALSAHDADLAVMLGDYVDDAATAEAERDAIREIDTVFAAFHGPRHYVLGNHCLSACDKAGFFELVHAASANGLGDRPTADQAYYSFDHGGMHLVVLDACFTTDGSPYAFGEYHWADANVPAQELAWLEADLAEARRPTLVLVHQRLDGDAEREAEGEFFVRNAAEVRRVIESSPHVRAVVQGHHHVNDLRVVAGVPYVTLMAMVDGDGPAHNAYALIDVLRSGAIDIIGFGQQQSYKLPPCATV